MTLKLASHSVATVECLVRTPECDVNIVDGQGRTVLHWAAARLDTGLLRLLVERGASVSFQDTLGNTPGHLVMLEGEAGDSLYTNGGIDQSEHDT